MAVSNSENKSEVDLSVKIAGKVLKNPVGVASGVFGFGEEYRELTNIEDLGVIYTKAVTPEFRDGNPPPRLAETTAGMINSIGLANPGLKNFIKEKVPVLEKLPVPAIVNVAGSTEKDYLEVTEALESIDAVWGIELNVSCPNVSHGGMAFGTDIKILADLTEKVRRKTKKPLIVKLSPNVTDISKFAEAAEAAGADALSCINTVTGMKIDIYSRKAAIPRGTGGLSGPAIKPIGIAAVWKVSKAVDIPVIGVGGIVTAEDAVEYLLAGASAVQIGSAIFSNPQTPSLVLKGIKEYLRDQGFNRIQDLHGFI